MTVYLTDAQNNIEAYFKTHKIPKYFYQCLFGELVKIWGTALIAPYNGDNPYREQLELSLSYTIGTGGWEVALEEACRQCNLIDILTYYKDIDWVHSDIFDSYMVDQMLEALFAKDKEQDYYFYKIHKENTK